MEEASLDAALSPLKLPFPRGYLGTHLIRDSWAHPSPQLKRHLDQFSQCCTAHRMVSLYFATEMELGQDL